MLSTPPVGTSVGSRRPGRAAALGAAAAAAVLAAACLLSGCGDSVTGARPSRISDMGPLGAPVPGAGQAGGSQPGAAWPAAGRGGRAAPPLPGVGPRTRAEIPADAGEVVLVSGSGRDSTAATVTFFRRDPVTGWAVDGRAWTAHGAARGWAGRHRAGDPRPPAGVFALADARGQLPAPVVKTLLRSLDPALHPVVVMGDPAALAR